MVYASELSVAAIVEGIRASRTVVKLQGPGDPMVELAPEREYTGDTVYADTTVTYSVTVTGGDGFRVRAVSDGEPGSAVDVVGDPFEWSFERESPETGETRTRVEVLDGNDPRVVTSHVWQRRCDDTQCSDVEGTTGLDDTGGATTDTTTEGGNASTSSTSDAIDDSGSTGDGGANEDDGGCNCRTGARTIALPWWLVAAPLVRRRRR